MLTDEQDNHDQFYTEFYTEDPLWSTPHPNLDEARRWGKICEFLSYLIDSRAGGLQYPLRLLDVGSGRGWLSHMASPYGVCEGVEPVANTVGLARKYFPQLTFYIGTAKDVLSAPNFKPYDIVISSEVIEHVLDKDTFVAELSQCLTDGGYAVITTPRAEKFRQWRRLGWKGQPVEAWLTERDLRELFGRHGFTPIKHDRAYLELGSMSLLNRFCSSSKVSSILNKLRLTWVNRGLQYIAAIYQVWLFKKTAT